MSASILCMMSVYQYYVCLFASGVCDVCLSVQCLMSDNTVSDVCLRILCMMSVCQDVCLRILCLVSGCQFCV